MTIDELRKERARVNVDIRLLTVRLSELEERRTMLSMKISTETDIDLMRKYQFSYLPDITTLSITKRISKYIYKISDDMWKDYPEAVRLKLPENSIFTMVSISEYDNDLYVEIIVRNVSLYIPLSIIRESDNNVN